MLIASIATANMSSNTPSKDADVSTTDDRLASLEVTEGQANIRSTDTSADGAARPSEEGDRVLDPEPSTGMYS